jgi:hypothetical protein
MDTKTSGTHQFRGGLSAPFPPRRKKFLSKRTPELILSVALFLAAIFSLSLLGFSVSTPRFLKDRSNPASIVHCGPLRKPSILPKNSALPRRLSLMTISRDQQSQSIASLTHLTLSSTTAIATTPTVRSRASTFIPPSIHCVPPALRC